QGGPASPYEQARSSIQVVELKYKDGGFKNSPKNEYPDTWSTFYCITSLKLLNLDELIEEKDIEFVIKSQDLGAGGDCGFFHCISNTCDEECGGNTSVQSTFLSLSTLALLNKLDTIDKKATYKFLKKKPSDDLELIFQTLSLKILNKNEKVNIEKKSSITTIWSIPETGISNNFPSIPLSFWTTICLGLLEKLDLVDFGGMFGFLRIMQQDNGGFTEEYTGLSSQKPNLLNTSMALLCIYYVWEKLIDLIENDILYKGQDTSNIYFSPIGMKYSVSSRLVKNIASWLIKNNWIQGKIFNIESRFQDYFDEQNATTQDIIEQIIKVIKSNPTKKDIDLNVFSKRFDFINALERVKLVINDLFINEFLVGNIKSSKKKYILTNYLILEEYIQLSEPIAYRKIMKEKNHVIKAKHDFLTLSSNLKSQIKKVIERIEFMIEQEKPSEAKIILNQTYEIANLRIKKFEDLIDSITSEHEYVKSKSLISQYETNWPTIKSSFEEYISSVKSSYEEKIKDKEELIIKQAKEAEDQLAINKLDEFLRGILEKLDQNQGELKKFFLENFFDHKAIKEIVKTSSNLIEQLDSNMEVKITEISSQLHFEKLVRSIEEIKTTWKKSYELSKQNLDTYLKIIEKRDELQKFIKEKEIELQGLSTNKKTQIVNLIDENKLQESLDLLNKQIKDFNKIYSKEYESFNEIMSKTNEEIKQFPDFSNDIIQECNKTIKDEENKWNKIVLDLKNKIHLKSELERKKELNQKLKEDIKDIENLIKSMEEKITKSIKNRKLIEAENTINELYSENVLKIKKYNQEFTNFIENATTEFETFQETVDDLIEEWSEKKNDFELNLEEIKKELEIELDKAYSEEKKDEIYGLIDKEISNLEDELNKLGLKYNLVLKSRKNLEENEEKFEKEHLSIQDSLKTFDADIRNSIRYASKKYDYFDRIKKEIDDHWETKRLTAENKIESVYIKISDDFFIKNVQLIVTAFKGKKIELNYLSKVMKIKTKALKLKLITLISNSKLNGELDSSSDTFTLTDGVVHEGVPLKDLEPTEEELAESEDEIIRREILKMRFLMVIHYRVGASVYSRKLGHWKMDSDMIGGFLTAMQDFSAEIKKKKIPMKRMEYKEFEILIEQGKYIFCALFIDGQETYWLRKKLRTYVRKFEKFFESSLKQWRGELRTFSNSGFLVDESFELYRV
ncbi:MAG: hypothetical protein ACFFAO_07170, partial [Candidatus Hermodarchaeota archaeon]